MTRFLQAPGSGFISRTMSDDSPRFTGTMGILPAHDPQRALATAVVHLRSERLRAGISLGGRELFAGPFYGRRRLWANDVFEQGLLSQ
jgi:hypothetical protein